MAEQPRRGSQRKTPAKTSAASGSARERGTAKATGKASSRGAQGKRGSSGREAVKHARDQVSELMGRPVESVLGMERDDEGWVITVQTVELARIPDSTDVLGDYAVRVDDDGEVIGYRQLRRYHRGQADHR